MKMQTNNSNMKQDKKYFSGIGFRYLFGTLLITVVQSIAMLIMNALSAQIPAIAADYTYTFLAAMLAMYLIGFPVVILFFRKIPVQDMSDKKKMSLGQWLTALFMSLAILYSFNLVGTAMTTVIGILKKGSVTNVMATITGSIHPVANLFIIVLCAPLVEEILFRKILVDRTIQYGEWISVVFSGFVFGLYHGNLNQFIYAFPLGCFFAFLYVKTKDIRYTISLHMVVNFFGSFVSQTLMDYSQVFLAVYGYLLIVAMIVGFILLIKNRKKLALGKTTQSGEPSPKFKITILNWGMGLYTLLWTVVILATLFM